MPENLTQIDRIGVSDSMDEPNNIDNAHTQHVPDLPSDEDLSVLEVPKEEKRTSATRYWLKVSIIVGLLAAAGILQSLHHGALFLSPQDNHILVMYRTQIAKTFGMSALRSATGPTYRLPFLEINKEMQYGDRRTTISIKTSNALNLALPTQQIEVIWRLDPEVFLAQDMQPLITTNAIEAVVAATVEQSVTQMLNETTLDAQGRAKGFSQSNLEKRIADLLSSLNVELSGLDLVQYGVSKALYDTNQQRLKVNTELSALKVQTENLVSQRADNLKQIKLDAEKKLAKMLSDSGVAMSALQDRIDAASQETEARITENRLSAETDREIYKLQAQHLMSMYKNRAAQFRAFFESNQTLHPALRKVVPTSLQHKPERIRSPKFSASDAALVSPEVQP